MKRLFFIVLFFIAGIFSPEMFAQCSICTKTAQQLGDGPASGLNTGILYLGFVPLLVVGYISFRWWKNEKNKNHNI
ncbi:MAG TPA: hypothetical protein PK110_14210 [Niabella sp.]|jgi:hypothetical protein|nr:hypothetical protein [Niabella sp.]HRO85975.1 hypothetical protein [Niabella sp.]HUN01576.1 hypothetical protein [Niabella sp.]